MAEHKIMLNWQRTTSDFKYETYNRNALITFSGNDQLQISNPPNYFGDAKYANPEELLIAALSCCYMQTFLAVACKQGYVVNNYMDHVNGVSGRNAFGKHAVTEITLNPSIKFADKKPDQETIQAMQQKAHDNCFISNSINAKVDINIDFS